MRVLEAISDTNIGGAGILLVTRLKHWNHSEFQVAVILPRGSALKKRLTDIGVEVFEIDGCRDRSWEWRAIPQYVRIFKQWKPDLIHCHGCLTCRVAAMLWGIPIRLYTRHCAYPIPPWQRSVVGKALVGTIQELLSHRIIAVAEAAKENLVEMGVREKKIAVIINGVEGLPEQSLEERSRMRKALEIPQDATVIGICARLEPCKGHMDFLRAAEHLMGRSDRYYFLIVGDGSLSDTLRRYCRQKKLDERVRFTGFAEDVSPYFNIMNLNVNCSVGTETSSLALSEGMSLGLPAVVSDYGGNPYMVRDGENGLVYPVGRAELLADAIHRLIQDSALYDAMSQKAYERFRTELNAKQMAERTQDLYRKLYVERNPSKSENGIGNTKINQ